MAIIEARGLARTFRSRKRTVEAVRGVDLTVREGEIVGFLGPNGAGKTTTLRMLTTLLRPTAGTATVAGADLLANPLDVRKKIGYVPQAIGETMGGTDPSCLVIEELLDQAALYRIGAAEARQRAERLVAQLELTGLEQRLVKTLSGGWRSRSGWCTGRRWSSWTSRPPAWIRRAAVTCGSTSPACGPIWAPRSSSPRTTWRKRTSCATGCSSSTTG
jgi:ABC-type multidrug transport system ATPase subunit